MENWIHEIAIKHLNYSLNVDDDYEYLTDEEKEMMTKNQFLWLIEVLID